MIFGGDCHLKPVPLRRTLPHNNDNNNNNNGKQVASLSERASEAVRSALLITYTIVQNLTEEIRTEGLDALFAVSDPNGDKSQPLTVIATVVVSKRFLLSLFSLLLSIYKLAQRVL